MVTIEDNTDGFSRLFFLKDGTALQSPKDDYSLRDYFQTLPESIASKIAHHLKQRNRFNFTKTMITVNIVKQCSQILLQS